MKRILDGTALALVWALGVGVALLGPTPAQAAGQCIRIAALDLNGDGWIDTPERAAAMSAGFSNVRSGGRLYTTAEEMNECLQGGQSAFNWLQHANPNYLAFSGNPSAPASSTAQGSALPGYGNAPSQVLQTYESAQDRGAAYDTPTPQAQAAAKAYLEGKVFGTTAVGRSTPQPAELSSPAAQAIMPAAGPPTGASADFDQLDANHDGIVTQQEYQDFMSHRGSSY